MLYLHKYISSHLGQSYHCFQSNEKINIHSTISLMEQLNRIGER